MHSGSETETFDKVKFRRCNVFRSDYYMQRPRETNSDATVHEYLVKINIHINGQLFLCNLLHCSRIQAVDAHTDQALQLIYSPHLSHT